MTPRPLRDHAHRRSVLVLGGTAEGRQLAGALQGAGRRVISSLAGRVANPRLPAGEVRVGGFGGVDGMVEYLSAEQISAVIDATHPFAAKISNHAATACRRSGIPMLILQRPPWTPTQGDRWTPVPDLAAAAAVIAGRPPQDAILLTTGRQGVSTFGSLPQRFWLRAVDPPDPGDRPARCTVILDRGPFDLDAERNLLRDLGITLLVTKNSGGPMTAAKLTAARELGIEVVIVERPPPPAGIDIVRDLPSALTWLPPASPLP